MTNTYHQTLDLVARGDLITLKLASQITKRPYRTLWGLLRDNEVPLHRALGRLFVRPSDLVPYTKP